MCDIKLSCPDKVHLIRLLRKYDAWEITKDFPVTFYDDQGVLLSFTIRKGFVLDFASVPWLLRGLFPKVGQRSDAGALIHDLLYITELVPRSVADRLFLIALREFKVNRVKADLMYSAVVSGGWYVWWKHDKKEVETALDLWVEGLSLDVRLIERLG